MRSIYAHDASEYVLTELLDGLNLKDNRKFAVEWVKRLRADPSVTILESSADVWQRGFDLYNKRADKEWSLTDCISFTLMTEHKITTALTHDHHFKQAGFHILRNT